MGAGERVGQRPHAVFVSHVGDLFGGAERSFLELVDAMHQAGTCVRVTAIVPNEGELAERLREKAIAVMCLPVPWWTPFDARPGSDASSTLPLRPRAGVARSIARYIGPWRQLLRTLAPDVVVTSTATIVLPALASATLRIPHVWWIQEFITKDHGLHWAFGEKASKRLIGALSRQVVANSSAVAQHFSPPVDGRHLRVVPYAFPPARTSVGPRVPGPLRLLLLGRVTPNKGVDVAITAVGCVTDRGHDVRLRIVGSAEPEYLLELRSLTARLGVEHAVQIMPHTSDAISEIDHCDVLLMCSRYEAFGRVTAEALINGRPVIGAASGGTLDLIESGVDGLLVPAGDSDALADAIVKLSSDPVMLATMTAQARLRNHDRFTSNRQVGEFCDVLGEAVKRRGARGR